MKRVFFNYFFFTLVLLLAVNFLFDPIVTFVLEEKASNALWHNYYRQMVKGTYYVLEQDLLRHPQQQWAERIETLKERFGYEIALMDEADIPLDDAQKEQLRHGRVVITGEIEYFFRQVGKSRMVLRKGPMSDLEEIRNAFERRLASGAFYVLEQELRRFPEQQWGDHIESLKPRFGYDLTLLSYSDVPLKDAQKEQLRQGRIVVIDDGEYHYRQVGKSRVVLRKGPRSAMAQNYKTPVYIALILFMALPSAIWVLPLWRKLRKISSTATAFGNGDFNVRVDIGKRSSFAPIADAFNAMADRIQQLINSHKELTNAIAHELRSPIARIRFGLEMQQSSSAADKKRQYAQGLISDVDVLEELVDELLTYAGFDREKPKLDFGFQPIASWLEHQVNDNYLAPTRVSCRISVPDQAEALQVWFEPKYLERALGNLVKNAIRYTDHKVHLILKNSGDDCFIHVDDDGPGIPEADRKRIFEPFTRLDDSRSRTSGGYGLGLAIVQRIILWHGGRVCVSESPLGGARFTLQWPGFRKR